MNQLDAHCPLVDGQGHAPDRPQSASAPSKFLEQMMARLVEALPAGRWLYELKFGGYRALAFKAGRQVTLLSRNRTIFNDDYRQLIDGLKLLRSKNFVIDGEIAALDSEGKSSFQLFQSYGICKRTPLVYYAFGLLNLEGTDLRERPLSERRKMLAKVLKKAPDNIRFSDELQGSREELLQVARQFGLEGLIAKRPDSVYEPGRRSDAWAKVKVTQQQEFVIGGYTPPEGSRKYFWRFARRLLRFERTAFRWQSRHRFLRKSFSGAL